MREAFLERWLGLVLAGIVLVAIAWLSLTGGLTLYMHPRYLVFAWIMAGIGVVLVAGAAAVRLARRRADAAVAGDDHHGHHGRHSTGEPAADHAHLDRAHLDHGHSHGDDGHGHGVGRPWLRMTGAVAAIAAALVLMLVAPARSLSADTASARTVTSGVDLAASDVDASTIASDTDFTSLGLEDWVSLLGQTDDPAFYAGKRASIIGFVTPDPASPADTFFVSRFVVTCCTVDAQPIGVPVHVVDWADDLKEGQWVQVDGELGTNPDTASAEAIALIPESVTPVDEPAQPYVY